MKTIPLLLVGLSGFALASESPTPETPPKGLAASDWSSIRAAYEAGRHAAHCQENGTLIARNPGQHWRTEFDGKGFTVTPDHGQWSWGLELTGYGEWKLLSASSSLTHDGGKITCQRDAYLTEWFINDTRGLEHGWTISSRSAGVSPTSENLTLALTVRGDLQAKVSPDSSSVSFQTASGTTALTYGGLKAWDADGKNLFVRFEPAAENAIRIAVEDQNARYPITIDPIAQQAYLKASNTDAGDSFGHAVAVSGATVVVGAPFEDSNATGVNGNQADNSASNSGAIYVFFRSGSTWIQQAYLKASNTEAGDYFGFSVAVSGDTVVVGAHYEDGNASGVNGNEADNNGYASGAAYVFTRSGTTWTQQAYLKASNTGSADFFGYSVAVSGDTVVVGAYNERSSTTGIDSTPNDDVIGAGAAYIFTRSGTTWTQQAYLKASNTGIGDEFGWSVSVSGDTAVVGAHWEDGDATGVNGDGTNNNVGTSGAAYVFVRNGVTWSQQAYLKASNTGENDQFGTSVSVSGDTVVVGAPEEYSSTTGVNSMPNELAYAAGAAYVFVRNGSAWSQQAYLKASDTWQNDYFGYSVAISGDTVVVGAIWEDGSSTGVNGNQSDYGAMQSGAAYVFARSGEVWSQQAYLKASNPGTEDSFGNSVAVSASTVVIGANLEGGGTAGVNTTPNESAEGAGAAYVFDLNAQAPTMAITAVSPDPRTSPVSTLTITFSAPVQNFDLNDLTLTRNNGPNLIDGNFSLANTNNTIFILTLPAAVTSPGGTYRLAVLVSNIVDLGGVPLGFGGEEQWLTLPTDQDTDNDGLNDAAEFNLRDLGFIWNSAQPALVNTLFANAAGAGLFTTSQVQALHTGTPLIARDPGTGKVKLTLDWKKSTDLSNFLDFPAPAGSAVSISPEGDVEFEFPSTDNAAFFRIELE